MKKIFKYLIGSVLMVASMSPVVAKTVTEIDSYGIYVVGDNGYVKVEPYSRYDNFVEFNYLNTVPSVKRGNDTLKIVVYQKDFSEESLRLELRPVDTVIDINEIKFEVKKMAKDDMYEVTVGQPVKDGTMLHVHSWLFDNMGVIMLGDTQEELVKFFSRKDLPNAPVVVQYLDDAVKAFPKNSDLKALTTTWEKAAEAEKDKKDYAYVEEKWQQYEQAEKLELKSRYLNAMIGEINGYLNSHPNGYKADEAVKRKAMAEEKLKEYDKLL